MVGKEEAVAPRDADLLAQLPAAHGFDTVKDDFFVELFEVMNAACKVY